ncbi:MAG: molybdopterin biosynthesis protein [Chloroflexales bacterium]|nr:molybdopterin biosynthesis protein [Chloroflexales bacterium]
MRRKYYLEDLPLDAAWQRFQAALDRVEAGRALPAERVSLAEAGGRITAEPFWARLSSPHYHAAAMDGVAVRAAETVGATETTPCQLVIGQQARWIDTGDPLPLEMDAVIMAEHVQTLDDERIEIRAAVAPWHHVRSLGEDMVATELVVPENHRLRPVDLGALAAAGHADVAVYRRPRVAIIPTGAELVTVEAAQTAALQPGAIIEFNSLMLAGQVAEWGGSATRQSPVPDRREVLREAITAAVNEYDIVVVNAGSSAGAEDYTAAVLAELGEVAVHGVAIRPGHPLILAVVQGKPVLGLPGYPVSTVLTAELFLRSLIYRMQGQTAPRRPTVNAIMSRKVLSPMGEDEFLRVTLGQVDDRVVATPLIRGAGIVSSLVRADGLVQIPRFSEGVHAGAPVTVDLLRDPAELASTIVAIGSHDLALDLLASHMRHIVPDARLSSANVGSLGGLMALKRRDAHLAGSHLLDEETGVYNHSFVARLLPDEDILLVNLAYREQGLIVLPDNPQQLHSLADLTHPEVRFVNRQKGSGTRVLLDYHLKQNGLHTEQIAGYDREEFTHMAVAAAVLSGTATVGLGIRAAARALGLAFIPLFKERYDLVVPRRHWESVRLTPLRQTLESDAYREAVAALGGYDVSDMGKLM